MRGVLATVLIAFSINCGSFARLVKRGTEFRISVASTTLDQPTALQRAIDITRTKLSLIKLDGDVQADPSDASVMIVRLYDDRDLERSKRFLFSSHQLELRKAVSPPNPEPLRTYDTQQDALSEAESDQDVFPYRSSDSAAEKFVILERAAIVTGEHLRDASAVKGYQSSYQIAFSLDTDGAQTFGEWTGRNIHNYIAILLDKRIQSVAFIKSQIFDNGMINGKFSEQEAEDIALSLKSGYLPATLEVIDEKKLGG